MTWLRIDDGFADHPKIVGLTDKAFRAHLRGLCYSARHLTDGAVPKALASTYATSKTLSELVDAGIWKPTTTGYAIHGYLDWNPGRAAVEADRARKAAAGRKGGKATWGGRT